MDSEVSKQIPNAGVTIESLERLPRLSIAATANKDIPPVADEVYVTVGLDHPVAVRLLPSAKLFEGTRQPPGFQKGPTPEYEPFFMLLERTAADYCRVRGRDEMDIEMERLYNQLRRSPDGRDSNPLFSYLRAAARLWMSLVPTSRAEFEAVIDRLRRSAKTFGTGPGSRNYLEVVRRHVP